MKKYNISLIGAGRVAANLGPAILKAGHTIISVHSRTIEKSSSLAKSLAALALTTYDIPEEVDVVLIMATDDSIKEISDSLRCSPETVIAHTAGSIPITVFGDDLTNRGVFYPLQTFSTGRKVETKEIPLLIEAGCARSGKLLSEIAATISGKVLFSNSEQRKMLHVAAVFACNFTNNMLHSSSTIMKKSGLPFEILKPLVEETVMKAFELGPAEAQTGPAIRNDSQTIRMQKDLLSFDPQLVEIYGLISERINSCKNDKKSNE